VALQPFCGGFATVLCDCGYNLLESSDLAQSSTMFRFPLSPVSQSTHTRYESFRADTHCATKSLKFRFINASTKCLLNALPVFGLSFCCLLRTAAQDIIAAKPLDPGLIASIATIGTPSVLSQLFQPRRDNLL